MFYNGIKLKADRLYKLLVRGGLILGCVSSSAITQIKIKLLGGVIKPNINK